METQILFKQQEEKFLSTDLIVRRVANSEFVLACSSDQQLCQSVAQAVHPSLNLLCCEGAQRSHGFLIGPVRWQRLCQFIQHLPKTWHFVERADLPPNAAVVAFLRAFIHKEVLFRPSLFSDPIQRRVDHARRIRDPFWVPEMGGNKWQSQDFDFVENEDLDLLPIQRSFETWQRTGTWQASQAHIESNDEHGLLSRLRSGAHIPAEQILGNYQGRTSERRTTNLGD